MTIINGGAAIAARMSSSLQREAAMGGKSKSGRIHRASRKTAVGVPHKHRQAAQRQKAWDQGTREPEEIDFEIDCQRIVQEGADRSSPRYYNEYN